MMALLVLLGCGPPSTETDSLAGPPDSAEDSEGSEDSGELPRVAVAHVSTGGSFACALDVGGGVECWGKNDVGQASPPSDAFTSISAGLDFACGLLQEGEISCWGNTTRVSGYSDLDAVHVVDAGWEYACALLESGEVTCWGSDSYGETSAPKGNFAGVSAGGVGSCAWDTEGSVTCWGLANPHDNWDLTSPPIEPFRVVDVGIAYACGLTLADDSPLCWGQNVMGETEPWDAGPFTQVSSGSLTTCALTETGRITCWGQDLAAPNGPGFVELSGSGGYFACAVKAQGGVECWGDDTDGQTDVPERLR